MDRRLGTKTSKLTYVLLAHIFFFSALLVATEPSKEEIINLIIQKAKENETATEKFGFYLDNIQKKLKSDGSLKEEKKRTYRMEWIQNQPYLELLRVDGQELDSKEAKEEKERREKFIRELLKKEKEEKKKEEEKEDFTWEELYEKYDFELLPADPAGRYVLAFQPKNKKLPERSRTEKLLNHLTGQVWADPEYNLVRVEAELNREIKFGLGIIARIEELQMEYTQQPFEDTWLPATMLIRARAQIALFKNERREITNRYYDFFPRPIETKSSPQ